MVCMLPHRGSGHWSPTGVHVESKFVTPLDVTTG
jgi:hypothetical protein